MEESHGNSPQAGNFAEVSAYVRELVNQGKMSVAAAQALTEKVYRDAMVNQELYGDALVGAPEELPEHLRQFPGATDSRGKVKFSQ